MPTLLEIYESHANGQRKQFADQVNEYGAADFARDIFTDEIGEGDSTNTPEECYQMLKTYIIVEKEG